MQNHVGYLYAKAEYGKDAKRDVQYILSGWDSCIRDAQKAESWGGQPNLQSQFEKIAYFLLFESGYEDLEGSREHLSLRDMALTLYAEISVSYPSFIHLPLADMTSIAEKGRQEAN